ncbi:MAG: hypothetical protein EOP86_08620 [Verrucomicrobiaceae bacterium]|nr:MAG: hypothetical protein EOP86_08620 [Verrucomicrobiaceae bacterium]
MKFPLKRKDAVFFIPAFACLAATLHTASSAQLLKYTFDNITDTDVPNTAPGATMNGTLSHPDQTQILSGETVAVNGTVYVLGKSLKFTPGVSDGVGAINDGADGLNAPNVDTGLVMSEVGITPTTDYTAMAWVNFSSQTGDNMIFGSSAGTFLHLGSRGVNYHSGHYGDDLTIGTTVVGQWHHVAYVNQGQTQSIYVDGALVSAAGATGAGSMDTSFNVLIGTSLNAGSFVGALDEVKIFDSVLTPAEIQAERTAGLAVYSLATRESQRLGNDGLTITLKDSPTSQVNPATITLKFDDVDVTPSAPVKNGDTTTIFHAVATPQATPHTWSLTAKDQTNTTISLTGSVTSPFLPPTLPGPAGAVGSWGMRELRPATPLGGSGLVSAVEVAVAAEAGTFVDAASVPVVNHSDPNAPGGKGNFNNDLPFIGDIPDVDDNQVVLVAKTKVTVAAAGSWTFDVHSDDGFAMRVKGARFVSSNGPGSVDSADPECLIHPADTGDSNTRGVCAFPAAGTYDIEFIAFEKGGGAFWEVAWAQGAFAEEKETSWTLVGNPSDPAVTAIPFTPRWLTPVPGPQGGSGTTGMRVYYGDPAGTTPDNLTQTFDFLRDTTNTPQSDPENTFDRQEATINHRDSGSSGGQTGLIGNELEFPPNTADEKPRINQDRVVVTSHGRLRVTEPGDYTFNVHGDDGFLLRLTKADGTRPAFKKVSGLGTFQMSNPNEMFYESGTGDTSTRGIISLDAGDYDLEYVMWEGGGGFWTEVSYAKGAFPNDGDTTDWRPLGYQPQAGAVVTPGVSDAGWTVRSTPPGAGATNMQTAEEALAADSTTSTWDVINFNDPEAGSASSIPGDSPWPRNTAADDNNYAMEMTATLVIPVESDYFFGFRGDDGCSLQIVGQEWQPDLVVNATNAAQITTTGEGVVNDRILLDIGTGDSRTVGRIHLAAGNYTLRSVFYEIGGGSSYEIVAAQAQAMFDPYAPLPLLKKGGSGQPIVSNIAGLPWVGAVAAPGNLQITGLTATGNPVTSVQMTWGSEAGKTYLIEATNDLATGPWTTVQDNIASGGASTTSTVNLAAPFAGDSRVFFRVKLK